MRVCLRTLEFVLIIFDFKCNYTHCNIFVILIYLLRFFAFSQASVPQEILRIVNVPYVENG